MIYTPIKLEYKPSYLIIYKSKKAMSILIISNGKATAPWVKAIKEKDNSLDVRVYPEEGDLNEIEIVLVWNYPHGILKKYPNLKWIASMGAGVDHILKDPDLPSSIPITRIVDKKLAKDMGTFVLATVLNHIRGLSNYKLNENTSSWLPKPYSEIEDLTIGIMGMGLLGQETAKNLSALNTTIIGWSRTTKKNLNFPMYTGQNDFDAFLSKSNILICLLPLTKSTENILNKKTFSKLPKGAYVINVARGAHLEEEDLINKIDENHLSGASLDVFKKEPLPSTHPFWKHPKINITPHIASITHPKSVIDQIITNYNNLLRKKPLTNTVSLERGY